MQHDALFYIDDSDTLYATFPDAFCVIDQDRMESVIEDPHILITDKKISAVNDILLAC